MPIISSIIGIMSKEIEITLMTQNPHWAGKPYEAEFKRLHDEGALSDLSLMEIQIITGLRRSGKSTLLLMMINHLMQGVPAKSILYLNFDDPNYTAICQDAAQLYDLITISEKLTGEKVQYLLLDEIQNVDAFEKYVKSVYDSRLFKKIILTGSNADLLRSDYINLLSGRYIETQIYPLRFQELLFNCDITDPFSLHKRKPEVLAMVDKMLQQGGFVRAHQIEETEQRDKILKNYYETILLKDCISNHKVRDDRLLTQLSYYLLTNIASVYSYNSLSKALGSNENTMSQFMTVLQNAYFIHEVKQFSYSLKSQHRSKKKPYCIDNGLIRAASYHFSNDYGKLLENLVYSELVKLYRDKIYFFSDQKECDFIIHTHPAFALQVCYEINPNNRAREIAGLTHAMNTFSIAKGFIVTYDQEEQISEHILVVPFWNFFSGTTLYA